MHDEQNKDKDIDQWLLMRHAPQTPDDLADRIIHRAVRTPQRTSRAFASGLFQEMAGLFIVPRPAFAMAVCLVIGVGGGWMTTALPDTTTQTSAETASFDVIVMEEDWI